jgi:hypothetical protein
MRSNLRGVVFAAVVVFTLAASLAAAETEKVLFNFQGGAYGRGPQNIVLDTAGNIYGTLTVGGNKTCSSTCGVVYKLSPNANGQLTESILHVFTGGNDGAQPDEVLMDTKGDLFVSAYAGGVTGCADGCGAVVELSPLKAGGWSTTVLYDFPGGVGGYHPYLMVIDSQGNLYGYETGGPYGQAFELSRSSSGSWTHKTIHVFTGGTGGIAGLPNFADSSGNIYGTAGGGLTSTYCPQDCGMIFKLSPNDSGTWTYTILYNFLGVPDGYQPSQIIPDGAGNIFGITGSGGAYTSICSDGCGTLFELSPSSGGGYTETVLHSFNNTLDGRIPDSIAIDGAGNLYTATLYGGVGEYGDVLKFTFGSDGIWEYNVLHAFANDKGGGLPFHLTVDPLENVYGVASGGITKDGLLFELPATGTDKR